MKKVASGSGRGRGWMKLSNSDTNRPGGGPSQDLSVVVQKVTLDENEYNKNSEPAQYTRLLSVFEQINLKDDGILLNQKLKLILKVWQEECKTESDVKQSFMYIYSKCLLDVVLASKVVTVTASRTFNTQYLHDVKIRNLFIGYLQKDYDNRAALQKDKPIAFRNLVTMLGEFYHKARLTNGGPLNLLQGPILVCLEMLVKSGLHLDLSLFTTLLYLNGTTFNSMQPDAIMLLLMQVRELLIFGVNLTKTCKTWLLLALDIANCRFGLLPSEIHKFYEDKLGEREMAHFQGIHNLLSIETSHTNKTLDSYQSSVSVLQVTPPESTSPVEQPNVIYNNWQPQAEGRRLGRPILGVGIRGQSNGEEDEWQDMRKSHKKK